MNQFRPDLTLMKWFDASKPKSGMSIIFQSTIYIFFFYIASSHGSSFFIYLGVTCYIYIRWSEFVANLQSFYHFLTMSFHNRCSPFNQLAKSNRKILFLISIPLSHSSRCSRLSFLAAPVISTYPLTLLSRSCSTFLRDFSSGYSGKRKKKRCQDGDTNTRPHPWTRISDALDRSTTVGLLQSTIRLVE